MPWKLWPLLRLVLGAVQSHNFLSTVYLLDIVKIVVFKSDYDWVWDNTFGKVHRFITVCGREQNSLAGVGQLPAMGIAMDYQSVHAAPFVLS